MTPPATFSFDSPGDAERAAELRRVKALATLVLGSTLVLFVIAKWLLPVHPVFGFIAAFAEAATIGGLADWYAVVALFKRPLGLPIPHTAIIQSNQARIADKLGEFIQVHFLEAAPVEAKLNEIDFGSFVADWLRDRKRRDDLARFALRLLPEAVSATESSGLMTFILRRMSSQLQAIDLAPLAAGTLRGFVAEGRHQILFDDLLRVMHETLNQTETMAMIREKVRAELPTLLRLYRADKFLVNKIVASATAFFNEVRSDPKHPFRGEFDRMVLSFVDRLGTDQAYIDRIDGLKRDLLARPELADLARTVWANTRSFIERSASGETQVLQHHLAGMCVAAGEALAGDAELRKGLVAVLRSFVADQKSGVSTFISDQVKSWDMAQLISLIEINIGRDLQYIRFNGSLIGGLAGLGLYSVEFLLRLL
ncbi:DUF445 domain-containing protein [Bradyrhizobium sp. WSM1253]|uniref:DUF445 domain-containing protein n=1 Tax=Bradyrhizobium sp. WSM1253 TaxID=319003 RepID=UPI00025D13B0|nr:DUF445 domain-containing protein [Bradyrhizobium sp. WSM1253]EIG57601.1 putative membrane protein [Bradyrhizobium sp. WSM1253]